MRRPTAHAELEARTSPDSAPSSVALIRHYAWVPEPDHAVEFAVMMTPERSELGVLVRGKVFVGRLRVGDVLTAVEAPRAQWNEPGRVAQPASLEVAEIHLYGHVVDEVDANMGVELLLVGSGDAALQEGVVLHGASQP
jgi:hypothetical protein